MAKSVFSDNDYLSLFDDLSIGISDGCGYVDTIYEEDVLKLYEAIKKLVEEKTKSKQKPSEPFLLVECFADNGEHSHWRLMDRTNGAIVWERYQ